MRSGLIGAVADFDDPAFMGDRWAGAYADLTFGPDPALAVEFLAALADEGSRVPWWVWLLVVLAFFIVVILVVIRVW